MTPSGTAADTGILLGFDFGLKRIGVAVGQRLTASARELVTLTSRDERPDWEGITRLVAEWHPSALVVGLPLARDGGEQTLTRRARRFGNQLRGRYNLPVYWVDERFTSIEAESLLAETGERFEKEAVDRIAARIILQSWLDRQTT